MKRLVGTLLLVSVLPSLCSVSLPPDTECGMSYRKSAAVLCTAGQLDTSNRLHDYFCS